MQSRKDELQAKRARLEEMRRQRALREQEFAAARQSLGSASPRPTPPSNAVDNRQEIDNLVSSLLGDGTARSDAGQSAVPVRHPSFVNHTLMESPAQPAMQQSSETTRSTGNSLLLIPPRTIYEARSRKPMPPSLRSVLHAHEASHSRGVQTMAWSSSSESSSSTSDSEIENEDFRDRRQVKKLSRRQLQRDNAGLQAISKDVSPVVQSQTAVSNTTEADRLQQPTPVALTDNEAANVTKSTDFLQFLDQSEKIATRALDVDYDVSVDYRLGRLNLDGDDALRRGKRGTRIKEIVQFYDEKWSKNRMITDLDFSTKFPELVLASYTKNSSSPYDPDGLVQIWNLHMPSRSEYLFHATSDVLTAKFHPFHPNLILGGAYSGQVYLWDTRSRSTSPVQTTPLTGVGHTHPVYSMNVIGTQNAHHVVTTSTDGILCSWATDMLTASPHQRLLLRAPQAMMNPSVSAVIPNSRSPFANDLSATCTAFPEAQTGYLLAGTEQGPIHLCHRLDRAGTPAGVDTHVYYCGHIAPVTSIDFHNAAGPHNLSELMLSTGMDWSIKLWRVKPPTGNIYDMDSRDKVNTVKPLLEFARDDAVYDVKWSPARPAIFATVDGAGWLDIWDLDSDLDAPVARERPSPRGGTLEANARRGDQDARTTNLSASTYHNDDLKRTMAGQGTGRSLNKCAWQPEDGRRIAVGGLDGGVTVFEVGGDLCGVDEARAEEWDGVRRLVSRLEGAGL